MTTRSSRSPRLPGQFVVFLLIVAALILGPIQAPADVSSPKKGAGKPYAVIFGTVWGPDNRPLYGVKVKIRRSADKKARWEAYSDRHGEFAVRVPAVKEEYVAWADLKGYKPADGKRLMPGDPVTIQVEYDERVDTSLHLK